MLKKQALSVSVGHTNSEDQLMHTFMDNFHQGGKYPSRIAIHQSELRREVNLTDQMFLSVSTLQTDYLNMDRISCCGRNSEREKLVQTKCNFCEFANHSA